MRVEDEKTLAALVLALGVVLALAFPPVTWFFEELLLPSLFFVMVFSLLPFARFSTTELTRLHPVTLPLVVWQQFLLPAIVLGCGLAFDVDREILYFVLVTVTSGSLFASPTLVQLMGLEQRLAVQTVIFSTLAAPLSIFVSFSVLHDENISLDLAPFAERLLIFLFVPIMIFLLARLFTKNWSPSRKNIVDRLGRWGSVFSLVIFCFALESEVTRAMQERPFLVFNYLMIAVGVAVGVAVLTRLAMARFGVRAAMTACVLASFRNIGLTFGLVGHLGGSDLAVYVGACQIPMFLSPLLFDFFFGSAKFRQSASHKTAEEAQIDMSYGEESADAAPGGAADFTNNPHPTAPVPGASRGIAQWLGLPSINYSRTLPTGSTNHVDRVYASLSEPAIKHEEQLVVGNNVMVVQAQAEVVAAEQAVPNETAAPVVEVTPSYETTPDANDEGARGLMAQLRNELEETPGAKAAALSSGARSAGLYLSMVIACVIVGMAAVWHANKFFAPMLFDQQLIEKVAEAHVAGKNFGVFDLNINIRDLREATVARMTETPDVAVLGASHWQEAHVELVKGATFFNSHIHRDYYEDLLAMTEIFVRHDRLPKELIVTIRDNVLTPVSERTDFLWLPGIKYYEAFAERIGMEAHPSWLTAPYQTWRELMSIPLLAENAYRQITAPIRPHATEGRDFETLDTLLPGGSILWSGEHKRLFDQTRARKEALDFAAQKFNSPPPIDPKGIEHLETLFQYLKDKGVKMTFAHPQFNPIFWDAVQGSPYIEGLKKIENLTKGWAEKYGVGMIGGFAPESVGCRADQYIDAEHGNPDCLGLLLQQYNVLHGRGDAPVVR
ncbi:MAG: hypothetical protein AAFW47_01225 [Pseudomonadota bacterium]